MLRRASNHEAISSQLHEVTMGPTPVVTPSGSHLKPGNARRELTSREFASPIHQVWGGKADPDIGDTMEGVDYGRRGFGENGNRLPGHRPLRVRAREFLCGHKAFFTLIGWRFLRRSMHGIWRAQLAYTSFAALLVGTMEALPIERRESVENAMRGFALLFDFTRFFLVFTLTAVVGTMYSRWWQMRCLVGIVMGRTVDTSIIVATYIQGDATAKLKCDLVRYLNLAHILVHVQARAKHSRQSLFSLEELENTGLLTSEEMSALEAHQDILSLHAVAYLWFSQLWLEAVNAGLIPTPVVNSVHRSVQDNLSAMRGAGGDIFMYQNTPPPIGYFRVLYLLLNASLLISPFGVYADLLQREVAVHDRWMVVPVVFMVNFFLLSFIQMCYEMFDPFSDGEGSHFPLKHYLQHTMRSSFALLEMPREGRLRYYRQHTTGSEPGSGVETPQQREVRQAPEPPALVAAISRSSTNMTLNSEADRTPVMQSEMYGSFQGSGTFRRAVSGPSASDTEVPLARLAGVLAAEQRHNEGMRYTRNHSANWVVALGANADENEAQAVRDIEAGHRLMGQPANAAMIYSNSREESLAQLSETHEDAELAEMEDAEECRTRKRIDTD